MPSIKDKAKFMEHVSELFHDVEGNTIGKIAAGICDAMEGHSGQDAMCALAFMTAFIVDSQDGKRETLEEFNKVVSKFINFDKPGFKRSTPLQ